jgi:hypothetical protein
MRTNFTYLFRMSAQPVLFTFFVVFISACSLTSDDENCPITAEPLTDEDFDMPQNVIFRGLAGAELRYITGECFGGNADVYWDYSGEAEFRSPANSINSFEFLTGGTMCAQLKSGSGESERLCKEVTVHRDHVWGFYNKDFPGGKSKQHVTMTLNGDVYSGFGVFNNWFKFDTATFEWTEKSSIPNLVDFNAFAGFAIDDIGYVVGNNSVLYQYLPASDSWTNKGTLPELVSTILNLGAYDIRAEYGYTVLGLSYNGKGYFGLGILGMLFEYDPATNAWKQLSSKPERGVIGDHVFGYQGKIYAGNNEYDIATDTWTKGRNNYNVGAGFSPGFVAFKGVMYGGLSGKTVTFDGESVKSLDLEGASFFVNPPLNLYGNGAATGNFIIFPRLMGGPVKNEGVVRYYIDK